MTGVAVDGASLSVTPPYALGSVVWVRPRPPQYRYQGYQPHGCWPGILREIRPMGYAADEVITRPLQGWWCFVQPCGDEGRTVMLPTDKGEIADRPCAACAAAWTVTQWRQLRG